MLKIATRQVDSAFLKNLPPPAGYHFVYRSPVVGLQNRWDLFVSNDSVAVISIRGTTRSSVSWLANFYSAMIPAKGFLQLTEKDSFPYELSSNPRAAIHVGWMISTAFLANDILPKIDSCYKAGIHEFIITGHSQGGAISYLMTAYLYSLKKQHRLADNIVFKTYCSAAPKPGNLYFAYEYENITRDGWAYNVVNSADWVPETPFSIQTKNDFNKTNPFSDARKNLWKQHFPMNLALVHAFNRLDKPARRTSRNYTRYLGRQASKIVRKNLKNLQVPKYAGCTDYVRTGNTIVLYASEEYYKIFPDNPGNVFTHHFFEPYFFLAGQLP
jgi:hypothetical protein